MFNTKGLILFLLITYLLKGQTYTVSPYSVFGVGDLCLSSYAPGKSMGETSISGFSKRYVNSDNPCSSGFIDTLSFIADFSITTFYNNLKTQSLKYNNINTDFTYFAIGFPISRKIKTSIGLTPFSSAGYRIREEKFIDTIYSQNTYTGEGGLSKVFLNVSLLLLNLSKQKGLLLHNHNIILGVQPFYLFGTLQDLTKVTFPYSSNMFYLTIKNRNFYSDYNFRYGLSYIFTKIYKNNTNEEKKLKYGLAFVFENNKNIKYDNSYLFLKQITVSGVLFSDTIQNITNENRKIKYPSLFGLGVFLNFNENIVINLDCKTQLWSRTLIHKIKLRDTKFIGAGIEYTPQPEKYFYYWKSVNYRAGVFYNQTYYFINNTPINEYGITFGIGLPLIRAEKAEATMIRRKLPTMFNFSLNISQRGTTENNLIKETFIMFVINLNIYDIWFVKRKYD
ncbi:MAG: hypothetical protein N3A01_05685 [Bacteroidales bacterium]|nr:hypothetical protein [Bacteroidales bacterium]